MSEKPLSPQQLHAVALLASGSSRTEAAQALGMSRSGLLKWLKLPGFRDALEAELDPVRGFAAARVTAMVDVALDRIEVLMSLDPEVHGPVVLAAAKLALERGLPVQRKQPDAGAGALYVVASASDLAKEMQRRRDPPRLIESRAKDPVVNDDE